jgi:hypothetical protein
MSNSGVRVKNLAHIKGSLVDKLLQLGHLAHLLEGENLLLLVTINSETGRVISAVFEPLETCCKAISQ